MILVNLLLLRTEATTLADTIFKVEYYKATAAGVEEWHGNGMLSFTASTGENLIAFTHRLMSEAVIIKDPFKHAFSDGGVRQSQRRNHS